MGEVVTANGRGEISKGFGDLVVCWKNEKHFVLSNLNLKKLINFKKKEKIIVKYNSGSFS